MVARVRRAGKGVKAKANLDGKQKRAVKQMAQAGLAVMKQRKTNQPPRVKPRK